MRGAALHFAKKITRPDIYDGVIVTDLMSLSDLKSLWGPTCPPTLVYFHENQLSYPLAPGESMDYQFGFTDITTALAAERVLFNSHTHFNTFFSRLPKFIKMMPEYTPTWVIEAIRSKSAILHPGCRFSGNTSERLFKPEDKEDPPLIIWNHRWEFDKNPQAFFGALDSLETNGFEFRLALLGENFQALPKSFIAAKDRFSHRIIRYGYIESKADYKDWLKRGSIVISTAIQENFGIAVIEAARFGCLPLLPNRLVYPEIITDDLHAKFLYSDQADMVTKLENILSRSKDLMPERIRLSKEMARFSWENMIGEYDAELERLTSKT
jgi:glycosyltransferase involved in cell wall biosynthesis